MMNLKKTALASAVALALGSGSAGAVTTTVGGKFILDKSAVYAGDGVNLALLGVNDQDVVDLEGEEKGAILIATVRSQIGEVMGGSDSPGEQVGDLVGQGNFAADVKYIRINKGNGAVHIWYPPNVSGTDTISVKLQERTANATGGGVEFNTIATTEKTIEVMPANPTPAGLEIASFKMSPTDTRVGKNDMDPSNGIWGEMTAGMSGGQIVVKALKSNGAVDQEVSGTVKVTLRGSTKSYNYSTPNNMQRGIATITLDSKVTVAGVYYIEATFQDSEGQEVKDLDSVDLVHADKLAVHAKPIARGLSMKAYRERILPMSAGGAKIKVQLLDEYGNATSNDAANDLTIKILDESDKTVTAFDLVVPANANNGQATARTGDMYIGNAAGEIADATTQLNMRAVAYGGNDAPITTVTQSNTVTIDVKKDALAVQQMLFSTEQVAGTEFFAFTVVVTDSAGVVKAIDPGPITITSPAGEMITVNRNSANQVKALFKQTTEGYTEYVIGDDAGQLAQAALPAPGISIAAGDSVELRDAHNRTVSKLTASMFDSATKQYSAMIPEVAFRMYDTYGNKYSTSMEDDVGQVRLSSSNADVAYAGTGGAASTNPYAIPGRKMDGSVKLTYDADGEKKFAGTDKVGATFTKPGVEKFDLEITVPPLRSLDKINIYAAGSADPAMPVGVPVNSQVPITTELLDQDGSLFSDPNENENTVITAEIGGAEGDTLVPTVIEVWGQLDTINGTISSVGVMPISQGTALNFNDDHSGAGKKGRKVFMVDVGAETGQFTLTFKDADEKVKSSRVFEVTDKVVDPIDPNKPADPVPCDEANPDDFTKCETKEACRDAGGLFVEGFTGVTDGCYGMPLPNAQQEADVIDKKADRQTVGAKVAGGILDTASGNFVNAAGQSVSPYDLPGMTIGFTYAPRPTDVGQAADLAVAVGMEPDDGFDGGISTRYYSFSENIGDMYPFNIYTVASEDKDGNVVSREDALKGIDDFHKAGFITDDEKAAFDDKPFWDDQVTQLQDKPYFSNVSLLPRESVLLVPDDLTPMAKMIKREAGDDARPGMDNVMLYFFMGYVLRSGEIVFNKAPAMLNVTCDAACQADTTPIE